MDNFIRKVLLAGMVAAIAACGTTTKPLWQADLENIHRYHREPVEKATTQESTWHNPRDDFRGVPGMPGKECRF